MRTRLAHWLTRPSRSAPPGRKQVPTPSRRPRLEVLEGRCLPTAYLVNTTRDMLGDTIPGELTLRDALTAISTQAPSGNAAAGTATNTVTFQISGDGPQTIIVG